MSIEEKAKPLEFTFIPDNIEASPGARNIITFHIVYDPDPLVAKSFPGFPLRISREEQKLDCPIELLTEVVGFLVKKGIIETQSFVGGEPQGFIQGRPETLLPIPQIEAEGEEKKKAEERTHIDASPFTSFDISSASEPDSFREEENLQTEEVEVNDKEKKQEGIVVDKNTTTEIPNRQVIRTRVSDLNDPTRAEKEASILRGEPNPEKTIKRK